MQKRPVNVHATPVLGQSAFLSSSQPTPMTSAAPVPNPLKSGSWGSFSNTTSYLEAASQLQLNIPPNALKVLSQSHRGTKHAPRPAASAQPTEHARPAPPVSVAVPATKVLAKPKLKATSAKAHSSPNIPKYLKGSPATPASKPGIQPADVPLYAPPPVKARARRRENKARSQAREATQAVPATTPATALRGPPVAKSASLPTNPPWYAHLRAQGPAPLQGSLMNNVTLQFVNNFVSKGEAPARTPSVTVRGASLVAPGTRASVRKSSPLALHSATNPCVVGPSFPQSPESQDGFPVAPGNNSPSAPHAQSQVVIPSGKAQVRKQEPPGKETVDADIPEDHGDLLPIIGDIDKSFTEALARAPKAKPMIQFSKQPSAALEWILDLEHNRAAEMLDNVRSVPPPCVEIESSLRLPEQAVVDYDAEMRDAQMDDLIRHITGLLDENWMCFVDFGRCLEVVG
ncbi:hypothetical protein BC834DRAFT_970249 [Gloeopeniophorella convolvens]|nr:hypothetical protein BC834DRAFT_970249 [Gloeopeniophorella convolvens]